MNCPFYPVFSNQQDSSLEGAKNGRIIEYDEEREEYILISKRELSAT